VRVRGLHDQVADARYRAGIPVEAAVKPAVNRRPSTGRRATAFTRFYGISDELWTDFKAEAAEAGVTIARAVGLLAEYAAQEIRRHLADPEPSREHPARSRDGTGFDGLER
jgi:hypothetical protein